MAYPAAKMISFTMEDQRKKHESARQFHASEKMLKKIESFCQVERYFQLITLNCECGEFSSGWPSFGRNDRARAFFVF